MRTIAIAVFLAATPLSEAAAQQGAADSARAAATAPLFSGQEVLELRLEAPLSTIFRERGERRTYRDGRLQGRDPEVGTFAVDVQVRMRGNFRADPDNCDFPPLRVNVPRDSVEGTVLAGLDRLWVTTHCRDRDPLYEQMVLREYLAYRVYNVLTDVSVRVRLAHVTYVDSDGRRDPVTRYAFIAEDYNNTAARHGWEVLRVRGVLPDQYERDQLSLYEVFQYMIGNTDWAVIRPRRGEEWCCHNSMPVGTFVGPVLPLPFDFDWSGLVNAPYARPNERLGIRSVRERRFWGICRPREELEAAFLIFNEQRETIYDLFRNQRDLDPRYLEETVEYFDEFYDVINDPDEVTREMMRKCRS